jgi:hypothetical protein
MLFLRPVVTCARTGPLRARSFGTRKNGKIRISRSPVEGDAVAPGRPWYRQRQISLWSEYHIAPKEEWLSCQLAGIVQLAAQRPSALFRWSTACSGGAVNEAIGATCLACKSGGEPLSRATFNVHQLMHQRTTVLTGQNCAFPVPDRLVPQPSIQNYSFACLSV